MGFNGRKKRKAVRKDLSYDSTEARNLKEIEMWRRYSRYKTQETFQKYKKGITEYMKNKGGVAGK